MEIIKRLRTVIEKWAKPPRIAELVNRLILFVAHQFKVRMPYIRQALAKRWPYVQARLGQVSDYSLRLFKRYLPFVTDKALPQRRSPLIFVGLLGIAIFPVGGQSFDSDGGAEASNPLSAEAEQARQAHDKEFEEAAAAAAYGTAATTTTNTMTFNTLMGQ